MIVFYLCFRKDDSTVSLITEPDTSQNMLKKKEGCEGEDRFVVFT